MYVRALGVVLSLLAGTGCASKASPYDRLCKIYEDYSSQTPTSEIAVKISQRVERELPEIFPSYAIVAQNSVEYRYDDFKELARTTANQPNWSCEAIRKFYIRPESSR